MEIKVLKATIILTDCSDRIILETKLPCPYIKEYLPSQPNLSLEFKATYDTGIDYVKNNFGNDFEIEIKNLR